VALTLVTHRDDAVDGEGGGRWRRRDR